MLVSGQGSFAAAFWYAIFLTSGRAPLASARFYLVGGCPLAESSILQWPAAWPDGPSVPGCAVSSSYVWRFGIVDQPNTTRARPVNRIWPKLTAYEARLSHAGDFPPAPLRAWRLNLRDRPLSSARLGASAVRSYRRFLPYLFKGWESPQCTADYSQ